MKIKKLMSFLLFAMFICLNGCVNKEPQTDYPTSIYWNNSVYYLNVARVNTADLDGELGEIKKVVTSMPKNNNEANNDIKLGSRLYKIKGENISKAIAIEFNNEYRMMKVD